jgi:fluoride ion exporter CrcB/FEX
MNNLTLYAAVAIGGAFGASFRFFISQLVLSMTQKITNTMAYYVRTLTMRVVN